MCEDREKEREREIDRERERERWGRDQSECVKETLRQRRRAMHWGTK